MPQRASSALKSLWSFAGEVPGAWFAPGAGGKLTAIPANNVSMAPMVAADLFVRRSAACVFVLTWAIFRTAPCAPATAAARCAGVTAALACCARQGRLMAIEKQPCRNQKQQKKGASVPKEP